MRKLRHFASFFLLSCVSAWAGTYTAATCSQADVNAVINGPSHTAVNGDIINIPAGTCTWTTDLSITVNINVIGNGTPNTESSQFGSGPLNTIIKDNNGSGGIIQASVTYSSGALLQISTLDIEPASSSTSLVSPIQVAGTCTSSGCPNIRIDNIGFGISTQWNEGGNSSNADWLIRTDNVFGVIDHNTLPNGSGVELFNANLSAYLGTGAYGDNSWAQPDTFGGANVLYAENNLVYSNQAMYDCDTAPTGGAIGGCRVAARYNHFYEELNAFALGIVHGLDTDGRPQSGRQQEAYGNTVNCTLSSADECGDAAVSFRGGTGLVFENTLTSSGASFSTIADGNIYRRVLNAGSGWGACGGSGAFDTDDGTVYFSGTTTSGSSGLTMNDTTKSWTTNQFIPAGAGYSVYDMTQGFWAEIVSNTATSITIQSNIPESSNSFSVGDSYQILRATVCVDQVGRGAGGYVSGSTPSPSGPLNQALDPVYVWDNSGAGLVTYTGFGVSYGTNVEGYRDWYTDAANGSPTVQTSSTSPFSCNGSTGGVGFGTLANRPSSCSGACSANSPGCGYFATDQGAQGTLYVWSSGAWITYYQPYTYPHPLDSSGTTYTWTPTIVGSGSLSGSNCGSGSYSSGTTIGACTAVPGTGYSFTGWSSVSGSAACSGSTNPCLSFSITANSAATATFTASGSPSPAAAQLLFTLQ